LTRRGLIALAMAAIAAVAAGRLNVGDELPAVGGETLSGKHIELPSAGAGAVRVLIFSFAKAAGDDSKHWSRRVEDDHAAESYSLIFLESAPRLFRGMAVSGIKSSMPKPMWDRTVIVVKDEALWKSRLAVSEDKHAYVVMLDGTGHIRWISTAPFSEGEYAELRKALSH